MINLNISGRGFDVDQQLETYVSKKIGELDKYLPRKQRDNVNAEITVQEEGGQQKNRFICEAVLYLPKQTLTATEGTINIYAAVDIVEEKLKAQIRRYTDKHNEEYKKYQKFIRKLKRLGRR